MWTKCSCAYETPTPMRRIPIFLAGIFYSHAYNINFIRERYYQRNFWGSIQILKIIKTFKEFRKLGSLTQVMRVSRFYKNCSLPGYSIEEKLYSFRLHNSASNFRAELMLIFPLLPPSHCHSNHHWLALWPVHHCGSLLHPSDSDDNLHFHLYFSSQLPPSPHSCGSRHLPVTAEQVHGFFVHVHYVLVW